MTLEQFDSETCRLAYAATLRGDGPADVIELVKAREDERQRLLAERDEREDA